MSKKKEEKPYDPYEDLEPGEILVWDSPEVDLSEVTKPKFIVVVLIEIIIAVWISKTIWDQPASDVIKFALILLLIHYIRNTMFTPWETFLGISKPKAVSGVKNDASKTSPI